MKNFLKKTSDMQTAIINGVNQFYLQPEDFPKLPLETQKVWEN